MTKVGKWSDLSESIVPGCTGILMLLVYIWSKRVALWSVILVGLVISCVQLQASIKLVYLFTCCELSCCSKFMLKSPQI